MDDVPPPEAFEPASDDAPAGGRWRRRLQVAVILILVASLVILAAVQGGGFIIPGDGEPPTVREAVVPLLAVVDAAGGLSTIDDQGRAVSARDVTGVAFQFPAWAPDGRQLAALGEGPGGSGVYVFDTSPGDLSATPPRVIYESVAQPPFYLFWSPDSAQLTFLTSEADGLALRMVPADGSGSAYVVRYGAPMYWDFVDAGRLLVHSGATGADAFFGEVGADGDPFQGTHRAAGMFRAPSVSTTGRYRAYLTADVNSVGEVVREARDGTETTRIRVFGTAAMSFSPAGDDLAFLALDQPVSSTLPLPVGPLRILHPGASEARTVYPGAVVAFFWSPTGEQVAVLELLDDDSVTEAGVGGTVLASTAQEAAAGLVFGLAFVDVASGAIRSERQVRLSSLFINQVLPFFDQYALSHRFWSPDAAAIALPLVGPGDVTQVTVLPADGAEPRVVATGEMGFWNR